MKRIRAWRGVGLAVSAAALALVPVAAAEVTEDVDLIGGEACVEFVLDLEPGESPAEDLDPFCAISGMAEALAAAQAVADGPLLPQAAVPFSKTIRISASSGSMPLPGNFNKITGFSVSGVAQGDFGIYSLGPVGATLAPGVMLSADGDYPNGFNTTFSAQVYRLTLVSINPPAVFPKQALGRVQFRVYSGVNQFTGRPLLRVEIVN